MRLYQLKVKYNAIPGCNEKFGVCDVGRQMATVKRQTPGGRLERKYGLSVLSVDIKALMNGVLDEIENLIPAVEVEKNGFNES